MKRKDYVCLILVLFPSLICQNSFGKSLSISAGYASLSSINSNVSHSIPGSLGDHNIKYFGRWDFSNSKQYSSYWGGAYFKLKFSGTTVKMKVGNKTNYFVKIDDGPWISYIGAKDTVNLTTIPLAAGMHTLTVAQGKDYNYVFDFQGLILDQGAITAAPNIFDSLIEYIGDSITSGYTDPQADVSDYAWVCSEDLDAEHTQIAYPGINLVSGYTTRGMDVQYFKQQSLKYLNSLNWDLTKYTPKIIVINLGTNDVNNRVPKDVFQNDYIKFLTQIRAKFPKAEIFAMRTFSGAMAIETLAAVNARKRDGDREVHYINTTDWLTKGTGDFTDGTHPSVNGHIKVAKLLKPILLPYLN